MKTSLKMLLLTGALALPACASTISQSGITSSNTLSAVIYPDGPVSQGLLHELSDSLDSYTLRLQKAQAPFLRGINTGSPISPQERLWAYHAAFRLGSLEKVRNNLYLLYDEATLKFLGFGPTHLNPLEKGQIETTMRQFIRTSNYADVENTTLNLELTRQSGIWSSYADILENTLRNRAR